MQNDVWFRLLAPYATWMCLALILATCGQVAKRIAGDDPPRWFRATMPVHPVLAGAVLGATRALPMPDGTGTTELAGAIYYGASGICCTWVYDLARSWVKAHRA